MKPRVKFILFPLLTAFLFFSGCSLGIVDWDSELLDPVTYKDMIPVTGGTFTQESDDNNDGDVLDSNESFSHEISNFKIGQYEVTFELWDTVYQKAITNGYTFSHVGEEGSDAAGLAGEPVTEISWRDAIVWCNAYSEMSGLTPVYYINIAMTAPLRTSTDDSTINSTAGSQDNPYVNWSANGFRLPTEGEWQYSASYIDGSSWTPWNYASGAAAAYNDDTNGRTANDAVAVYRYFWESSANPYNERVDTGVTGTAIVGSKNANSLGLYDMSGNVAEWCWDYFEGYPSTSQTNYRGPDAVNATNPNSRVVRGGSFEAYSVDLPVWLSWCQNSINIGNRLSGWVSSTTFVGSGFRVAQTE